MSNAWTEKRLYDLANVAWSPRREVATEAFIFSPEKLPSPDTPQNLTKIVECLYAHARHWCPGFNTPLDKPAGYHGARIDVGFLSRSTTEITRHCAAVRAMLVHEACHEILNLSGIRGATREDDEKEVGLAVFICGFGEIFFQGYKYVGEVDPVWKNLHAGHLTEDQYVFANRWVLRVQSLLADEPEQIRESTPTEDPTPMGFLARLLVRLRNRIGLGEIVDAIPENPNRARSLKASAVHTRTDEYRISLARLSGDKAALERLIEYERRKRPDADESDLLDAVMESLERDRT